MEEEKIEQLAENPTPVIPHELPESSESEVDDAKGNSLDASTIKTKSCKRYTSFVKSKWGIITIIGIVVIVCLGVYLFKKVQAERNYEKNLSEFVVESGKASMAAGYICDDLKTVWQQYIFDDKEYFNKSTGNFTTSWNSYGSDYVYCSDFSEAVNKKIKWNEENLPSTITEPYYTAKRLYKEMTPAPDKYKDIHVYVKQMFKAMEHLHELSSNPTGNLSTYSSNCNEAVEEYTSALSDLTNESDIDFSKYNKED